MDRQLQILELVRTGQLKPSDAVAELAKKEPQFSVSKTGAVQVKGLRSGKGQPVTLYKDELFGLFELKEPLLAFVKEHENEVKNRAEGLAAEVVAPVAASA